MSDEEWKQSAVMFYAAACILVIITFVSIALYYLFKNDERKRKAQSLCCFCCFTDAMVAYDSINTQQAEDEEKGLLSKSPNNGMFTIGNESSDDEEDVDLGLDGLSMQQMTQEKLDKISQETIRRYDEGIANAINKTDEEVI